MLILLLALAFSGLVIGALGRLVVPGPNPMGIWMTIAIGIAGSVLGGIVGHLLFGFRYRYAYGFGLVLSVLFAALLVVVYGRRRAVSR